MRRVVANVTDGLGDVILQLVIYPAAGNGRRHFFRYSTSAESHCWLKAGKNFQVLV